MLKIKVSHNIGDIVKNSFNDNKYKVILYNYIESVWIKYICMQSDKDDFLYLSEIELKKTKERTIWFI